MLYNSTFVKLSILKVIKSQKKILVAPLDWGLGHTTRCVPVVSYLRQLGHKVVVAGNDWQLSYFTQTFPGIDTLPLAGYNVHYSKNASGFIPNLFIQLPRLLRTMQKEHDWLQDAIQHYGFNGIITDNRYGLYHDKVPSVIICHQVAPQTGWGAVPDGILQVLHNERLSRFQECWVPDIAGSPNLAGSLSHPAGTKLPVKYIGLLSQIGQRNAGEEHLMVLLSGPEPQRTMLSDILWEQLKGYKDKIVFIEGSDYVGERNDIPPNMQYHKRITGQTLEPLLAAASMVICRSGYSTLMDLAVLHKKAILIPTPGQAEQEYLARHLHKEGVFYHAAQKRFDLQQALTAAQSFPFKQLNLSSAYEQFKPVADDWLSRL